jgi:diguanylate cyclase (GGDEF)-like protein
MPGSADRHPTTAEQDPLVRLVAQKDALLRVAREVAGGAPPAAVFATVAREVADILGAEAGIVWRYTDEGSRVVGSFGEHRSQLGVTFPLAGDGAVVVVSRTGRPARCTYAALPPTDPTTARVVGQGYTSGVAAPLSVGGRLWGAVLAATTGPTPFPPDAEERLEQFAEMAALAIANAQAREELTLLATIDGLTGVVNQGEFHRRLDTEVARARRHGRPLALVVLDLDHFKRVNDDRGHQVGDRVLQHAARAIAGGLRSEDVLARVGGEEFAVILPEVDARAGVAAAERMRCAVARVHEEGIPAVTASAGVAELRDTGDHDALFAAADQALYVAKGAGRNRVHRYDPADPRQATAATPGATPSEALAAVRALALAVDAKDPATRRHSERVASLVGRMAAAAGWGAREIEALRQAALVHDVGKIGVPDRLLLETGPLTSAEYERVKVHPALGAGIVAEVLGPAQTAWVRHHHERADGSGYPDGLAGADIPEGARLMAVADAFDVMTRGRAYAPARTPEASLAEIRDLAGVQFDPAAVAALEDVLAGGGGGDGQPASSASRRTSG